jgi:hypothetical protein
VPPFGLDFPSSQLVEHPLVKMLREHDLLVDRLGAVVRKRRRGLVPSAVVKARVTYLTALSSQYHFPRTNPPNAISPINAMIKPIKRLQTIATTIPTITMIPPSVIPPYLRSPMPAFSFR